jgi:hypothetical protein
MLPTYLDPDFSKYFERKLVRPISNPLFQHKDLLPAHRLHLIVGQKGLGLKKMLTELCEQHKMPLTILTITENPKDFMESLEVFADNMPDTFRILLLRRGFMLKYHRDPRFLHLERFIKSHFYILVEDFDRPDPEDPFYNQFSERFVLTLPTREFHKNLLEYYFGLWKLTWKHSKMLLSPEDFDTLAMYAAFTTPADVRNFSQKVFADVSYAHPETAIDITREYIEENHLFTPFENTPNEYSIVSCDRSRTQDKLDPARINLDRLKRRKRSPEPESPESGVTGAIRIGL